MSGWFGGDARGARVMRHAIGVWLGVGALAIALNVADARQPAAPRDVDRGGSPAPRRERGLLERMTAFHTEVPDLPRSIILVRPTPTSITASIVCKEDGEGFLEYQPGADGRRDGELLHRTAVKKFAAGVPLELTIDGLSADTAYCYRWRFRSASRAGQDFEADELHGFCTPRGPGRAFTFTIQADSHLDANMSPAVYEQTLANALSDAPDFHIDLGDTFMTDKRGREFLDALPQYVAQRYYFGRLCHSAPLFMALGNHDGEVGYANNGPDSMAPWSYTQRTTYFPPPAIAGNTDGDAMYTGRTSYAKGQGANYYEFTWGDAQFIVLDPFWFTSTRPRGGGGGGGPGAGRDKREADTAGTDENWSRTLGREQYDWLTRTLEASTSKYTLVFIHHLVGGLGKANRGGVESSVFFEWGGKNSDGSAGFAEHRPGWAMPIHDLLVKHHVSGVFHGHDHLYVRSERDGLVYQCVPQPGNPAGGTRSAAEYGYESGTILGSPGHLRVRVAPEGATVEFIRSAVAPADGPAEGGERRREREANGAVVHSYTIAPQRR